MEKYYLSSLDSYIFEEVRECIIRKKIVLNNGRQLLTATINPPVIIHNKDIGKISLINRYEDESLFPILEFPCFVNVLVDMKSHFDNIDWMKAKMSDFQFVAVCELYKSRENAEKYLCG